MSELQKIVENKFEKRPLVKELAEKYYRQYRDVPDGIGAMTAAAASRIVLDPAAIQQIGEAIRQTTGLAKDGTVYVIRYDSSRLSACPFSREIIEAYAAFLRSRASDPKNVILIPSSQEGRLISVVSYKSQEDRHRNKVFGEGVVNISGDLHGQELRIVNMLNMAVAASNVRLNTAYNQMDDSEMRMLKFIRQECKAITGLDVPEDRVLKFIKDLPRTEPCPINRIEEYNRVTLRQLQQSA